MDRQHSLIGPTWFTAGEGPGIVDMIDPRLLDLSTLQHNIFPRDQVNEAISTAAQRNGGFSKFTISPQPKGA
jgi:threonine dehydrogenase-like Zn-dependent dehydrogenase